MSSWRMASERCDHALQPTALVHEAYVRLLDGEQAAQWNTRGHFFAAAAEAMRCILVEHARASAARSSAAAAIVAVPGPNATATRASLFSNAPLAARAFLTAADEVLVWSRASLSPRERNRTG